MTTLDTSRARANLMEHEFKAGEDYGILKNLRALHERGVDLKLIFDYPIETFEVDAPEGGSVRKVTNIMHDGKLSTRTRFNDIFKPGLPPSAENITDDAREGITEHAKYTVGKELKECMFDSKIFDIHPAILAAKTKYDEDRVGLVLSDTVADEDYMTARVRTLKKAVEGISPNNILVVGCFPHHKEVAKRAGLRYESVEVADQYNPPFGPDILSQPEQLMERLHIPAGHPTPDKKQRLKN